MSELSAIIAIAVYLLTASGVVVWYSLRSAEGWRAWLLYAITRCYSGLFLDWRANKACPFPRDGGAIILANHSSPVDPMLLWMNHASYWPEHHIRVPEFLMAREYYEQPGFIGWISRTLHSIPVDRDGRDTAAVRESLRRLKAGKLVGIFPEGGINPHPDRLRPGRPGLAWMALKARVPVFPVFIHNAPRGTNMVNSFYTRSHVRIVYGEPVDLSRWHAQKLSQESLARVTDELMSVLAGLGGIDFEPLLASAASVSIRLTEQAG